MPSQICFPVVRIDSGDIELFGSIDDLVANTEAIDVRHGVYEVFDAAGRRCRLIAPDVGFFDLKAPGPVQLEPDVMGVPEEESLRNRLLSFLMQLNISTADLTAKATNELVTLAWHLTHKANDE
ncbi:MAG: hypothetical protein WKF77_11690 [Planctomycetaceae bacterium]